VCQGDSRPTRKVHSNRKARQGRKEILYIHKKLPERNRGAVRKVLIQVLPACRQTSTLARCARPPASGRAASGGRGPGGRNLMDHCDLCELCGEMFGITGGGRGSGGIQPAGSRAQCGGTGHVPNYTLESGADFDRREVLRNAWRGGLAVKLTRVRNRDTVHHLKNQLTDLHPRTNRDRAVAKNNHLQR